MLASYRKLGKPLQDDLAPTAYTRLQTKDDERTAVGRRYYNKSGFTADLSHDLIDALIDTIARANAPNARIAMSPKGGAGSRVARDANAFWYRQAQFGMVLSSSSEDPARDAAITTWARTTWPVLERHTDGFYANTNLAETPAERVREAYGGNYERLVQLKNKYDPTNLFRLNANVTPTVSLSSSPSPP
jgi:FAD/FMN-containing dehydrogenase